ncbi:uncharacterized protein LOC119579968 [Penaeus monodon]|uniref:uncharacterized protein LOC119579968 n=1 Tax=Penaeus monodon TaxID=6687 RepID=UPI0018A7CE74|nr:uncharacterized protein LOC119579968 [Penaeus monodon]
MDYSKNIVLPFRDLHGENWRYSKPRGEFTAVETPLTPPPSPQLPSSPPGSPFTPSPTPPSPRLSRPRNPILQRLLTVGSRPPNNRLVSYLGNKVNSLRFESDVIDLKDIRIFGAVTKVLRNLTLHQVSDHPELYHMDYSKNIVLPFRDLHGENWRYSKPRGEFTAVETPLTPPPSPQLPSSPPGSPFTPSPTPPSPRLSRPRNPILQRLLTKCLTERKSIMVSRFS